MPESLKACAPVGGLRDIFHCLHLPEPRAKSRATASHALATAVWKPMPSCLQPCCPSARLQNTEDCTEHEKSLSSSSSYYVRLHGRIKEEPGERPAETRTVIECLNFLSLTGRQSVILARQLQESSRGSASTLAGTLQRNLLSDSHQFL